MEEFLPIEIEFLAAASNLPEEYVEYFLPPLDDGLVIPAQNEKVGKIEIQIFAQFICIRIGDHTEVRISSAAQAVRYIREVLTNQVVFYFSNEDVEYFQADDFKSMSELDWNYYVWSGPFRYVFLERGNKT